MAHATDSSDGLTNAWQEIINWDAKVHGADATNLDAVLARLSEALRERVKPGDEPHVYYIDGKKVSSADTQ